MEKEIKILHLFPDLLNLYGDLGNITSLKKRCEWRGIKCRVLSKTIGDELDFNDFDIVLLGGGSDREQRIVCDVLREMKDDIKKYVESDGVFLGICGGYQLLGEYYETKKSRIEGLGILNFHTVSGVGRHVGNIVLDTKFGLVIGFENHSGETYHDYEAFGKVKLGFGNNSKDNKEGLIYKNILGTYLHGPLLPKNPKVTDSLILKALKRKYGESTEALTHLDDDLENTAQEYAMKSINNK